MKRYSPPDQRYSRDLLDHAAGPELTALGAQQSRRDEGETDEAYKARLAVHWPVDCKGARLYVGDLIENKVGNAQCQFTVEKLDLGLSVVGSLSEEDWEKWGKEIVGYADSSTYRSPTCAAGLPTRRAIGLYAYSSELITRYGVMEIGDKARRQLGRKARVTEIDRLEWVYRIGWRGKTFCVGFDDEANGYAQVTSCFHCPGCDALMDGEKLRSVGCEGIWNCPACHQKRIKAMMDKSFMDRVPEPHGLSIGHPEPPAVIAPRPTRHEAHAAFVARMKEGVEPELPPGHTCVCDIEACCENGSFCRIYDERGKEAKWAVLTERTTEARAYDVLKSLSHKYLERLKAGEGPKRR